MNAHSHINKNIEVQEDTGQNYMNPNLAHTIALAKGKDVHNRIAKLGLYKECLAIARSVDDKRASLTSIREVQEKWRQHRGVGGSSLELHLASTLDRIAYGRLCLSKQRQRTLPNASEAYDWGVENPMENHASRIKRREERESPDSHSMGAGRRDFVPMANWGNGNMDPDMIKRHKELTDRQFFMGPHWRAKPKPMLLENLSFEEQMHVHFQAKPKMKKTPKKHY